MKKNMSWKFTDELSVTFQLSVSGAGEFGLKVGILLKLQNIAITMIHIGKTRAGPGNNPQEILSRIEK